MIIATKLLAEGRSKHKASAPLLAVWDRWVASLHLPAATLNNKYHPVRQHIKAIKPQAEDGVWLLKMAQQKSWTKATWQGYKGLLLVHRKSC
ncbi:hypothetical protein [Thermostichus vulcanus]|uniref:Uncharacterized protein n=1 Tax=Thermostichus vulcanus str. 'Rupite' TaxID=2813851 RepID=A0ABT0CDA7_THEVL|nr:hypothetical protein [Thermostichus vulcanus]MCJ2543769.1 hypothetical protein [Thermostichus vulcanus str. 'Rupite']